ncbi:B12-binding domain-containing radical SAM protein [Desulfosarcina ovata subsp. sediminis]|uniref:B12-binding domain-containing radical SAM protein n=1 Tax=Desulfosarcina ovata subsp. sediminis TaxID=885957 RepID=A0A5K8A1Z9_9BACT|nr:radical SAM protein [Desulfosarcina ovata]BBO86344.1 B12-binding domain-containing radical SAM protein [Desulfosarcina ovata subsp. sediminis]
MTSTATTVPHILLVNPWIHDFAAYDFWAAPLGLLTLGGILRDHGARISFVDCLDRFHPLQAALPLVDKRCGRGPYMKTTIPKPPGLADIPRNYCRYGVPPEWLRHDLAVLPPPDLVLVTSLMTYWYPGVRETIAVIKSVFPDVPVVLGGIYATLCAEHAERHCGADHVISGPGEAAILPLVARLTGWRPTPRHDPTDLDTLPLPALDLTRRLVHVPLLTSRGCPFQCAYCASHRLQPRMMRRSPTSVVAEIVHWHRDHGVKDFAFYDDALLVDAERHIVPLLEGVIEAGITVRFHTPNALHIRNITRPLAILMRRAGFHTIRLGLETTAFERRQSMDRKVTEEEFLRALNHLKAAGFAADQVGAYLLAGLPGQDVAAVESSIAVVKAAGITPVIAHYTPIPHTPMWEAAVEASRYDLAADPIYTNNAIFPCRSETFSWEVLTRLKTLARA